MTDTHEIVERLRATTDLRLIKLHNDAAREIERLAAQWEHFAGYEAGEHERRSRCISDALRIEDESTTKQCKKIDDLRADRDRLAAELAQARELLEWLDSRGGLGLDVHKRVRAILARETEKADG